MSPLTRCDSPGALRGGVPILFPQFGTFGPLRKHGFARTELWYQVPAEPVSGAAVLALRLHDSSETRASWPAPFELTMRIVATADVLDMSLTVVSRDDYEAEFTGGLHNYFRVTDPGATISGLSGLMGWDAVVDPGDPEKLRPVGSQPLVATTERDLIVHDVSEPVVLHDPELGDLRITATGFPNRVIWNPGPNHTLPDVAPGAEAGFVCIEPAAVAPVHLGGQETWMGSQRLEVLAGP